MMRMSEAGKDFLIREEGGLHTKAYYDQAGIPTISIGVTRYSDGKRVKIDDTISISEAQELFDRTIAYFEWQVDNLTPDEIFQHQFDALVSLTYNIGVEAFRNSTLRKLVLNIASRDTDFLKIAEAFMMWINYKDDKGILRVSKGLVQRRLREFCLYINGKL
jgi:lysozyme